MRLHDKARVVDVQRACAICIIGVVIAVRPMAKGAEMEAATDAEPNRFALLIGVTVYPNLDNKLHLEGPGNDVPLVRKLLIERLGFQETNIVMLSDQAGGEDKMPTRANIEREWRQLAKVAKPGDQVLVTMSGHGSQTPQQGDDDLEVDGYDEIFLPRDIGKWNDEAGGVKNMITDDEIRAWIQAILAKGASVFVVIDACHSGTMTRAVGERYRELPAESLGIPQSALDKAAAGAAKRSEAGSDSPQLLADDERSRGAAGSPATTGPTAVALYACRSTEKAPERPLPQRPAPYYGLLTYTFCEVLSNAKSKLTYRELVANIHREYTRNNIYKTPQLEGTGLDREVLGWKSFPASRIRLSSDDSDNWTINAGALSGVTTDSILAVFPAAGEPKPEQVVGHVKVLEEGSSAIKSRVEPCGYRGMPAPTTFAAGMRCETVYVDMGDQRLRVAVDLFTDDDKTLTAAQRKPLDDLVKGFVDEYPHLAEVVTPDDAAWLLRYETPDSDRIFLVPASGWSEHNPDKKRPPLFGPAPTGETAKSWIGNSLSKIARAQGLLRIAGQGVDESSELDIQLIRYRNKNDRQANRAGKVVQWERDGLELHEGDQIRFRVKNLGSAPVDVTLLMIDSGFGIQPIFPRSGHINRVDANKEVLTRGGAINAKTTGKEHLIAIAVKSKERAQPVSFTFLAQSTIERTRSIALDSPLGKLFDGKTRGWDSDEIDDYEIRSVTWETVSGKRPK